MEGEMIGTLRWRFGLSLAILGAVLLAESALSLSASAAAMTSAAPTVKVAQDTTLGSILTDSQGMTLYIFKKDKPGESVCEGTCAQKWPPLTTAEGMQPVAASGIPGKLGEIKRKDDTYQVTYDSMPLYRYAGDSKPGETSGQGFGGVWYVVPTAASTAAKGSM
jgi:predicted lipoprotein with Yx(FWY)xxD motif